MLETMEAIALGLFTNLISNLVSDGKMNLQNQKTIKQIRQRIGEFNRKYDNTVVDTHAFQNILEKSKFVERVYTRIFKNYSIDAEPITDFKRTIALYAIEEVNKFYKKYSRCIKDEEVFYEYFSDLVDTCISIREGLLTLESSIQTAILTEKVGSSKREILEAMQDQFEHMKEDNCFAEDKINEIKSLVNLFKYTEAEKELSNALEAQQFLSNSQRELVYYQRARIYINTGRYSELEKITKKIRRINSNSKYLTEIKYYIACHQQDVKSFEEAIESFVEYKYSSEQILLKRVYFEFILEKNNNVCDMITINGKLKEELLEYPEVHFYFGHILNQNCDFNNGYLEFSKAFELRNNIVYKYNSMISKYHILMNERIKRADLSEKYIEEVNKAIDEFKKIKYITEYQSDKEKEDYWVMLIELSLIIDPKKTLNEITKLDEKLSESKLIRSMKAEVYYRNNMTDSAKIILEELWKYIPHNTMLLFTIYANEGRWNEIIVKYKELADIEYSENPTVIAILMKAKSEVEGYENVRDELLRLTKTFASEISYIGNVIKVILENNDELSLSEILRLIDSKKGNYFDSGLQLISELLYNYSKFEEVRELIEDRVLESEALNTIYIRTLWDFEKKPEMIVIVNEKVKELYNNGCRYRDFLMFKVQVEKVLKLPRKVIQTLEEYKKIHGIDDYYASYFIDAKIEKKEYDNLEEEVELLLSSNNPVSHQLVAILKAKQEKWDEAQRIALSALYNSHSNLGKEVLRNYISMHFSNLHRERDEVDLEEARNNTVITLESKGTARKIAIHTDKSFLENSGEIKFDCENYHADDTISILLTLMGKKGEIINLEGVEYRIVDIVDLYVYFNRFCLIKLQTEYPDHSYFINCSAPTPEELIGEMMKIMASSNQQKQEELKWYNFQELNNGLPISFFSGNNIDSYSEMIISLLNYKKQHLYAGEIAVYKNKEYVISLSSIIFLAKFDLLDKLEQVYGKCVITVETEKSIREGTKESQKHAKLTSGFVNFDEDGELYFYSYTEEDKRDRKAFWARILQSISKLKNEKVEIDDNDMYEIFAKHLLDEDVSSIELSKKSGKVLVCDDLFIRKLHHGVTATSNTTNFVGFLISEELLTCEEFIDLMLKLLKVEYLYPLNAPLLFKSFLWVLSIESEDTRVEYFEKMKEIYRHILDEGSEQYYNNIYHEIVKMTRDYDIPVVWVYELVREPLKLKPLDVIVNETINKVVSLMVIDDDNK